MEGFERDFDEVARSCEVVEDAAKVFTRHIRDLKRGSREGNIVLVKRAQAGLAEALAALDEPVDRAVNSWRNDDEREAQYLDDGYAEELRRVAAEKGLNIFERDGQLISYPSIVRILSSERAVRVDKRLVRAIRPSHLTDLLLKEQQKRPRNNPQTFLNTLYGRYQDLARDSSRMMGGGGAPVILLARIYEHITAMSWVRREYSRTDFARDLYQLETSGVKTTRSGAVVSFEASTGTRSSRNLFTFVGPDGHEIKYYGIRFTEG